MIRMIAATAVAALAACSPQPAAQAGSAPTVASAHPVSGLPVVPLTVITPQGSHTFQVEVARSAEEQAQGLMFRTKLGPDEGMIFLRQPNDPMVRAPPTRATWGNAAPPHRARIRTFTALT